LPAPFYIDLERAILKFVYFSLYMQLLYQV
jgi:hypothetical protein